MKSRQRLHLLIDQLPDHDIPTIERVLEAFFDSNTSPGWSIDDAPEGEPDSPEEAVLVAEAYEDIRAGRVVSHEEIKREFGLRE